MFIVKHGTFDDRFGKIPIFDGLVYLDQKFVYYCILLAGNARILLEESLPGLTKAIKIV